jgi:AraC-like DNA-binding protein
MYRELAPSAALRPWVACYWSRDAFVARDAVTQRVLPDGCVDVIFDCTDAHAFGVGAMTSPLVLQSARGPEMLGVRFRPGRGADFFGMPLAELTDTRIELPLLDAAQVADRRIAAIEELLLRRLAIAERDARVDAAVARIEAARGAIAVDDVARFAGMTRQHLRRRFLERVGISPKMFARVVRFQSVLANAANADAAEWAGVAAEHGYADQSHLIADFRELAGTTPVPFFLSLRGTAP